MTILRRKRFRVVWVLALVGALSGCATTGETPDLRVEEPGQATPADINVQLGVGYMQRGNYELALAKFQKALDLEPNLATAHHAIAILYERLNQLEAAERHYLRAVTIKPGNSEAQNAYGVFLCRHGKAGEADRHFELALNNPLYSTPETAYANAGICAVQNGDLDQAETYLRKSLQIRPTQRVPLYWMASLSYQTGRYLSARGYLQRYQQVARHNPQTLWLGIQLERELGDKDAEASYALLLRSEFPDSDEAQLLRESR